MSNIKFKKSDRGFSIGEFTDRYDNKCSIQESSLATEAAIWLGISDPKPEIMSQEAIKLGLKKPNGTEDDFGWCDFEIPEQVILHTRMHLTIDQVKDLIPVLQHFVRTGYLPKK